MVIGEIIHIVSLYILEPGVDQTVFDLGVSGFTAGYGVVIVVLIRWTSLYDPNCRRMMPP